MDFIFCYGMRLRKDKEVFAAAGGFICLFLTSRRQFMKDWLAITNFIFMLALANSFVNTFFLKLENFSFYVRIE